MYDQKKYDEKYWRISSEDIEEVVNEVTIRDRNIYNGYTKDNRVLRSNLLGQL